MSRESSLRRVGGVGSAAMGRRSDTLADVLERVLDKGIVIAGDIVVNVLDIELLTLRLRLFVSSADTAREMGLDWWTNDPFFSGRAPVETGRDDETKALRQRVAELEELVRRAGTAGGEGAQATVQARDEGPRAIEQARDEGLSFIDQILDERARAVDEEGQESELRRVPTSGAVPGAKETAHEVVSSPTGRDKEKAEAERELRRVPASRRAPARS